MNSTVRLKLWFYCGHFSVRITKVGPIVFRDAIRQPAQQAVPREFVEKTGTRAFFFFCSRSKFRAITRLETLATQASYEASKDTSHRLDHFSHARGEQLYKFREKEFNPHGIWGVHQCSRRFVRYFRNEVTGDVTVSYWSIFSVSSVTVPEVFANVNSSQFPSRF